MDDDLETWLLDTGDEVIRKKAHQGASSLTELEKAIYSLWVIDYAVRNSGTLEPMAELYPSAIQELLAFSRASNLTSLAAWLVGASDEQAFCNAYYTHFGAGCKELHHLYARV